jgi:hypothetical protein
MTATHRGRRAFVIGLSSSTLLLLAACAAPISPNTASVTPAVPATSAPSALPTLTAVPTPVPGVLFVDAAQNLGPLSPYVYGSNYGPWLGISAEAFPYVTDAKLTFMRWPGGSWGDQNDVTLLQVDQFIQLCRKLGWEPMINVRLEDGTPEKAAALVEYANVTKGYGVRYWAIGNEPNIYVGDYPAARFNREWRAWATAMRAVDPALKLIGPEISQFYADPDNEYEQAFADWMIEFLKANGDLVDIVSIHRYPFPKSSASGPPAIADLRDNSREWDALIPYLRALIREHAGRDLPIAVTEVNSSYARNTGGEATMDSHYNAIWWGDVLGRLIRQRVEIVAQWDLVREFGIVGRFEPHPMYYTYLMYQHFGSARLYASSDDPYLSIFAAKRADDTLTLMLINLASEPAEKSLRVDNFDVNGPVEVWRFDADHPAQRLDDLALRNGDRLTLPPESITVYALR